MGYVPPSPFNQEQLDELDKTFNKWHEAKTNAAAWKEVENDLRLKLFGTLFPNPVPGPKNKVVISHGMAVIGDYKINMSVDIGALTAARDTIDAATLNTVVGWSPRVKDAGWNALSAENKVVFSQFITGKVGTPSLELKKADSMRWPR